MRQRLGLAQALMENPDILLLDEPLSGLDNDGVQEMWKLFNKLWHLPPPRIHREGILQQILDSFFDQVTLKNYSGKKVYVYLPKEIKETVNKIVAEFAKDEDVAELYAEWNKINREKLSLYYEKKEPDIPLENNKEFRSLKNDIIRAAVQMESFLVNTGYSTEQKDWVPVHQCVPCLPEVIPK